MNVVDLGYAVRCDDDFGREVTGCFIGRVEGNDDVPTAVVGLRCVRPRVFPDLFGLNDEGRAPGTVLVHPKKLLRVLPTDETLELSSYCLADLGRDNTHSTNRRGSARSIDALTSTAQRSD